MFQDYAKVKIEVSFVRQIISVQNTFSLEESLNVAPTRDLKDPVDLNDFNTTSLALYIG